MASGIKQWTRFIRFVANNDSKVYYGEPINLDSRGYLPTDIKAKVIQGNPLSSNYKLTEQVMEVKKLLAPVENVPIFICIGLNYKKHAEEANIALPKHPVVFTKPPSASCGPNEPVIIPKIAQDNSADYELELGVVIGTHNGRICRSVSEKDALKYVAGYTVCNDISARKWQMSTSQWTYGKSFDTFAPFGPQIVSPLIIPEPGVLDLKMKLNGKLMQNSNTRGLIFNVAKIISHCSNGTTLLPGTVIMTGTPEGVGMARNLYIKEGDVLEGGIEKIGYLVNSIKHEQDTGHV